jgi:pimeloyl-ACP methyl ester carboxylesterase
MPDMRGHGRSTRVQLGDDVDMAADVADLLAQYHNDHPTWSEELIRLFCK